MNNKIADTIITVFIFGITAAIISFIPWVGVWQPIGAGKVGVVTRFGAVNRVVDPGFAFKFPLIESIHEMETRTQKEEVQAAAASKDLQEVKATVALNYRLQGDKAVEVYQNIGNEYKDRMIAPALQEAFKATTAKFTASELIERRDEVKQIALMQIKKRMEKYHIIVEDFNIVNFDFSKEFNQAIEQKTVAQQNKERAEIEKQTALIQAQGQADAQAKLKESGSLTPEYLQFIAIQKWNGELPKATNGNPFINIQ